MIKDNKILVAKNESKELFLIPKMANRHGVIAGASGSGKTVTLKTLAEGFSAIGTPVFLADVKGDLAGMCLKGETTDTPDDFPTCYFDITRKKGLPVRTTVSDFGPVLFSHILELNQIQSDLLNIVFKIADDNGLLLLDLKDLKKTLEFVQQNSKELSAEYGNIPTASIQTIQRGLISLEQSGISNFFGETALDINDLLKVDTNGKGFINVFDSESIITMPRVYGAFMLWLLTELYENMPEVGDLDKPKIVFFFDEAHLLFNNASKSLIDKITQVTKLIRSKGIGLYYISQSPTDIPNAVLTQLGNKIQHVFRAYSVAEQKNLKAVADSFRPNSEFKVEDVLGTLGTGEACISLLDETGAPSVVEKAKVVLPQSKLGTIPEAVRDNMIKSNLLYGKYINDIDRESAYEVLNARAEQMMSNSATQAKRPVGRPAQDPITKAKNSVLKSTGSTVGRELGRVLASSFFGQSNSMAKNIAGNIGSSLARNMMGTLTSYLK